MKTLPELDSTSSSPAMLEVLRAVVRLTAPDVCVELGTYQGHGAVAIGRALRANGCGHLFTCDPTDHGIVELLESERLVDYVSYLPVPAQVLVKIASDVDFAYIDHAGGTRLEAFLALRGKLRRGGIIVVDDTGPDAIWHDGSAGANKARVRELCQVNVDLGRGLSIYRG